MGVTQECDHPSTLTLALQSSSDVIIVWAQQSSWDTLTEGSGVPVIVRSNWSKSPFDEIRDVFYDW